MGLVGFLEAGQWGTAVVMVHGKVLCLLTLGNQLLKNSSNIVCCDCDAQCRGEKVPTRFLPATADELDCSRDVVLESDTDICR